MCVPSLAGGGAERQLAYLAEGLVRLGVEVHVGHVRDGPNLPRLRRSGAFTHRLRQRNNHDPTLPLRIADLCRRTRPDIVQTWMRQMDIAGGVAARVLRLPWIVSERSSAGAYYPSLKHMLRARLARGADAIISNSLGGDAYWQARVGPSVRRWIIRNALPLDELSAAAGPGPSSPLAPPGKRIVLFSGRFVEVRNIPTLLKAFLKVLLRPDVAVVMCGEGPLIGAATAWRRRYGLEGQAYLPGYVDESRWWRLARHADAFVSVSSYEGNPNSVLEAMALGAPLVVSDIPEHREFLDEGRALFAPPGNWERIADRILETLDDPAGARARAERARASIHGLSLLQMASTYLERYRDVLRAPRRGGR